MMFLAIVVIPSGDGNNSNDSYDSSDNRRKKWSSKRNAISSKRIITVDGYIDDRTFGKVFFCYYNGQAVAWKIYVYVYI